MEIKYKSNLSKEFLEDVNHYIYFYYPFLKENKSIHRHYISDIFSCVSEYALENGIIINDDEKRSISNEIINNKKRMIYLLKEDSVIHDLHGNVVSQATFNDKYFARIRLREIRCNEREVNIEQKLDILKKKIKEISDWKNHFLQLNNRLEENINKKKEQEKRIVDQEILKEQRLQEKQIRLKNEVSDLKIEVGKLKCEKNSIEMQKTSKNIKIGKTLRDMIINQYLESQRNLGTKG